MAKAPPEPRVVILEDEWECRIGGQWYSTSCHELDAMAGLETRYVGKPTPSETYHDPVVRRCEDIGGVLLLCAGLLLAAVAICVVGYLSR